MSSLHVRKEVCKFSKTIFKIKTTKGLYWLCGSCADLTRNRGIWDQHSNEISHIWDQTLLAPCSAVALLNPVLLGRVTPFAFCFWLQALRSRSVCVNRNMEGTGTKNGWLFKMNLNRGRGLIKNVGLSKPCFSGILYLQRGVREWGGNVMEMDGASL